MKRILIISALICSLCSSFAYGENPLLSIKFWKTASVEDVNSAVANGADINASDKVGVTALIYAARFSPNPEVIERLLKLGADVSYKNTLNLRTALAEAKRNKSLKGTKAYQILRDAIDLVYREKPFFSEEFWKTAIVEDVNSAVANGADVTADMGSGWTVLMLATGNSPSPDVIERLVELGADVNARDKFGMTALMMALDSTNPEVIDLLVKLGADVNARDTSLGRTILMLAAQGNNTELIERLVRLGADVNARDKYQRRTALMWAARFGSLEVIERLVKLGADVPYKNECGHTALSLVKENKVLKENKPKAYKILSDAVNKKK